MGRCRLIRIMGRGILRIIRRLRGIRGTASMVLGIIAVISAFFATVYPPIICGGLSIILSLLSKGNDKAMLPNAKVGLLTGILGMVVNVVVVGSFFVMLFTNPSYKQEFHDQLNQYSEYFYGESFDDMWEQIQEDAGYH